jgi:multiple sugar transport system permease protein
MKKNAFTMLTLLFCVMMVFVLAGPIAWGISISLKSRVVALDMPPAWFFTPTLSNYKAAFLEDHYGKTLFNSLIIAISSSVIAMSLAIPAAYTFSRTRFRGHTSLFIGIMTVRMAPATVIAIPLFLIFAELKMIDTYFGIALVHAAVTVPLAVWLLKGFFDEIPTQIDDVALLDGDNRWTILSRQILPVCIPGLFITTFFCFINSWNEFFLALMLTGYDTRPFTVALPALITPHGTFWGQVTAISTVGLLPGILFALVARRYINRQLEAGGLWR